jgi:hypothetical protein
MFSTIAATWPPAPGPDQTTTGELVRNGIVDGSTTIDLGGLHAGAWWTGLRLAVPSQDGEVAQFEVSLQTAAGELLAHWPQTSGVTCHLTWPIPAAMAAHAGLSLRIRVVPPDDMENAPPIHVSQRIYFHELPDLDQDGRYVFLNGHQPAFYWNGQQEQWGGPDSAQPPSFGLAHTVIPKMEHLVGGGDGTVLFPESWLLTTWEDEVSLAPSADDSD